MLPGFASVNFTLRAKARCFRASVETHGCKRRKLATLTQGVRDVTSHSKKIRSDAENLREQNLELAGEIQKRDAHTTVEFARLKVVAEELSSVETKLVASRGEEGNSHWYAHSIGKGSSKVEDYVGRALMIVFGGAANATK